MDPNDQAKYLNSPETELFDKGRSLYNHGPAREAAGKGHPLLVAEGYMDVIALVEAGFAAAVAPLGTAVTEHQLALLWRIADEPVIALDGDTAGMRAAMRVVDLALPLLEAGKSLRFAVMPEGQDPDDLIRAAGPEAVQKVLSAARPMVQVLWQRETEGQVFDSPERKAKLDKALREKIKLIRDPSIRQHYGQEIKDLRWALFRPERRPQGGGKRRDWRAPPLAQPSTRASVLAAGPEQVAEQMREAVIVGVILKHPDIALEFEAGLESLTCSRRETDLMRHALLQAMDHPEALPERVAEMMGANSLESYLAQSHFQVVPCLRHPGDAELARLTVAEELAKLEAARGLKAEIAEAQEDLLAGDEEALTWRLRQATDAMARANASGQEDTTEYDIGANGASVSKQERSAFEALLETIKYSKPGR